MWKVGDRNGDFILVKREDLGKGVFRDTWIADPVVTLTPDATVNEAFYRESDNASTPFTSPDNATVEFSSAMYTNVQSKNGVFASVFADAETALKYANVAEKATFNTSGYSPITDITCIWKGRRQGNTPSTHKLQVYKATVWEDWLTTLPTVNTEYTKSLGDGSAYFYNTTWIRFGLYMVIPCFGDYVWIQADSDYMALQITYGVVAVKRVVGDGLTCVVA